MQSEAVEVPMTELEILVSRHNSGEALTERDRAQIERAMWNTTTSEMRKRTRRDEWLMETLGKGSTFLFKQRAELLNSEPATSQLWKKNEEGTLPLATAYRIFRNAKVIAATEDVSLEDAIDQALREYDQLPSRRTLADGSVVKARIPTYRSFKDFKQARKKAPSKKKPDSLRGDDFWDRIRDETVSYIAGSAEGIDPIKLASMANEFTVDLKTLVKEWQGRLYRLRTSTAKLIAASPERRVITAACQTLSMDPPKPGKPIDQAFLKLADKQKKRLARLYHPDTQGEVTRAKFEAVVEAFNTLRDAAENPGGVQ